MQQVKRALIETKDVHVALIDLRPYVVRCFRHVHESKEGRNESRKNGNDRTEPTGTGRHVHEFAP
jgi:hypothetical protein